MDLAFYWLHPETLRSSAQTEIEAPLLKVRPKAHCGEPAEEVLELRSHAIRSSKLEDALEAPPLGLRLPGFVVLRFSKEHAPSIRGREEIEPGGRRARRQVGRAAAHLESRHERHAAADFDRAAVRRRVAGVNLGRRRRGHAGYDKEQREARQGRHFAVTLTLTSRTPPPRGTTATPSWNCTLKSMSTSVSESKKLLMSASSSGSTRIT